MTGEEHARTVKWEKHKRIQRMDTAVPNKFARAGSVYSNIFKIFVSNFWIFLNPIICDVQYDTLVSQTTGFGVDEDPKALNSNILDGNFLEAKRDQEELPVLDGLAVLTSRGFREKQFTLGSELMQDIQKESLGINRPLGYHYYKNLWHINVW